MDKILLVIGDAAEVLDTMIPYYRLLEDYEVHVAGPEKRVYHLVQHDTHPDWDITIESPGYKLKADVAFRDVKAADYLGMVVSGGRAPEYLRYDQELLRVTREFFAAEKPVASVCHGIEILAAADVIRGRRVTTVRKCRFDAEYSGGEYVDAPVALDGCLVTSRTWHDCAPWMKNFVKMLNEYKAKR
ncbi:MAG: DJ-1/PfpI family protein [Planctomycetia bacterium]